MFVRRAGSARLHPNGDVTPHLWRVIPDARVEIVKGGWHHPWLADALQVASLLRDFLIAHDS